MRQVTATGQNVEEAVKTALAQLQTTRDRTEISIMDEGKKGIFGFGSRPAVVKVTVKINPIEEAVHFIKDISDKMGVAVDVEVTQDGKQVELEISGDKMAMLIGKRGQTLNSPQYLTQLVINRHSDQYLTVILDAENYRKRRSEILIHLAERLAQKAIKTGHKVALEPMPSYERKVIHTALVNNTRVKTYSEGVEPNRHIAISPER